MKTISNFFKLFMLYLLVLCLNLAAGLAEKIIFAMMLFR